MHNLILHRFFYFKIKTEVQKKKNRKIDSIYIGHGNWLYRFFKKQNKEFFF